jgi:hypothetical protein
MAREVFNTLMQCTEQSSLIVPLTQITTTTNIRAKPVLINIIDDLTDQMYATKAPAIHKYVVPLVYRLIDDTKVDVRNAI